MRKFTRLQAFLFLPALLLVVLATARCNNGSTTPTILVPTVATITSMPSTQELLAERTVGLATAPNQIIEYVSFWSPASASYHLNIWPQVKTRWVDSNLAQVLVRNVFQSGETLTAAKLARCAGADKFMDAVQVIFTRQSSWGTSADPDTAMNNLFLGFGMSQAVIDSCRANADLQNLLIAQHNAVVNNNTLNGSLPILFVNGTLLQGPEVTVSNIALYIR